MLTEGWDANTVTHILGVRPFRSQLLCEQVVGRGLRRRSYAANEEGRFEPEYAEIYGVPFAFIPGDHQPPKAKDPRPAIEVRALDERWPLAIRFPKLDGYRVEMPDEHLYPDFTESSRFHLLHEEMTAMWVQSQGVIGQTEEVSLDDIVHARPQRVSFQIAKALVESDQFFAALDGVERPWLVPQLVDISRSWLDTCVTTDPGITVGYLLLAQARSRAAEKVYRSIVSYPESRTSLILPVIRRFDREGTTDEVHFVTRKVVMDPPPTKSPLNHVVLDGLRGNSWEEALARFLEDDDRVVSYVKNERLGFTIPYVHAGRTHDYIPDFLVRLRNRGEDVERTLIVEVSGSRKSPGPTEAKANTARNQWCAAVNHDGSWGRWGYVEVHNPATDWPDLDAAIEALYQDQPIIGLPA